MTSFVELIGRLCSARFTHDGSIATLEDVIEFYSEGGHPNASIDSQIRPRDFILEEKRTLVAFLRSLNGRLNKGFR